MLRVLDLGRGEPATAIMVDGAYVLEANAPPYARVASEHRHGGIFDIAPQPAPMGYPQGTASDPILSRS
jgi:hypothetical protein